MVSQGMKINRLTALQVGSAAPGKRYADGGGLYLVVTKTGSRNWAFIYEKAGKQREMGLGKAGHGGVSLAEARKKAGEARLHLADGRDPLDVRRAAEAAETVAGMTFGKFADAWIADNEAGWSNPKHRAQWKSTLSDSYLADMRQRPVAEIAIADVLASLKPIWTKTPETARRIRMRIEKVLDAAKAHGLRTGDNPARWKGNLDHLLPRLGKATKAHHAALPFADLPAFMVALSERESTAALALRFTILTAARTSEVLNAEWAEVDLGAKAWTIPADRMKARRPHRVPLSAAALDVLSKAKGKHDRFIFPGPGLKSPLSNMALLMQLRRMDRADITAHGFRSTFRDWAAETTAFPREVAEMALAHVVASDTEAAYRRGDLFEKRRNLMSAWGDFCSTIKGGKVIPLARP